MAETPTRSDQILKVENLKVFFEKRPSLLGPKQVVHAVDDVSLSIGRGEVLSLVGESGSGKSTLARTIVKLNEPDSGRILFGGKDIFDLKRRESRDFRRRVQMIFQDPYESLNPQSTVYNTVLDPMEIHHLVPRNKTEKEAKVSELLRMVGLDPNTKMMRYPHELSGGERQRVSIARALSVKPDLVIADEPVSMLDVSIRIGILNLMLSLKNEFDLTYFFITHDLGVAKYVGTKIAVMYFGKIVEVAESQELISHPMHRYTNLLLASIPQSAKTEEEGGEREASLRRSRADFDYVAEATNPPPGCRFHPRCPYAKEKCKVEVPALAELCSGHYVACHYPRESWEEEAEG